MVGPDRDGRDRDGPEDGSGPRLTLRFFLDHGAGGCLWPGNDATRDALGVGALDADLYADDGGVIAPARLPLSAGLRALRDRLDGDHADWHNPVYPPDPSLWSQARCDRFNAGAARLLALVRQELGAEYLILDEQPRHHEDPGLAEWLARNPGWSALP